MRRRVLIRSIERYLEPDEVIRHAAQVWRRHRLMVPFVIASFALLAGVAAISGFEGFILPASIGAAGAALAGAVTTNHTIVVLTNQNLVLLSGSRIRAVATGPLERLPTSTTVKRTGGTTIISDWSIDGHFYNSTKAHEHELAAIQNA